MSERDLADARVASIDVPLTHFRFRSIDPVLPECPQVREDKGLYAAPDCLIV